MMPPTRRMAARFLFILVILMSLANLNMWINNLELGDGTSLSTTGHTIRLIIQVAAILLCIWISQIQDANEEVQEQNVHL